MEQDGRLVVNRVDEGFSFDKAGVQLNDLILSVNRNKVSKRSDLLGILQQGIAGTKLEIQILREHDTLVVKVVGDPFPYEQVEGVHFDYGSFVSGQGDQLRTIVSRPKDMKESYRQFCFCNGFPVMRSMQILFTMMVIFN